MESEKLTFSWQEEIDRDALLAEAATRLEALRGHLGTGSDGRSAPEAGLVRDLLSDQARFAGFPDVYEISDKKYLEQGLDAPVRLKDLSEDFRFFWMRVPVSLWPTGGWAFSKIEAQLEFNPGEAEPHRRPKAYQIFPHKKFQTLIETNHSLAIGLNENFELTAGVSDIKVDLGVAAGSLDASAGVAVAGDVGLKLGPGTISIKKAKIDHTALGLEWVFWRITDAEFLQEDNQVLVVVLQVPRDVDSVVVTGSLRAYRNFYKLKASLQQLVSELPERIRAFFVGGLPTEPHQVEWDLKPRL